MSNTPPVLQPAPLRAPMFTRDGVMALEWQRWFQQLFYVGAQVVTVSNTTTDIQTNMGFDDRNPVDFAPNIEDAANLARDTARVYDDSELRNALAASDVTRVYDDSDLRSTIAGGDMPRVYDDSELRNTLAGSDTPRVYDDTEIRSAAAGNDTTRVYDDSELRNALAGLDTPNSLSFQQQIDEVRALIAAGDNPQLTNLAPSATTDTTNASNITSGTLAAARVATLNQNTTGTAANVTGTVAIANGGTGQTTAAAALTALGAASLTANNTFSGTQTFNGTVTIGNVWFVFSSGSGFKDGGNGYFGFYNSSGVIQTRLGMTGNFSYLNNGGGNVGIGTASDNGVDRLQVSGSVNASAGFKVGGSAGVSGTITLAKLTTGGANGSITVTNGIITGFTNPT